MAAEGDAVTPKQQTALNTLLSRVVGCPHGGANPACVCSQCLLARELGAVPVPESELSGGIAITDCIFTGSPDAIANAIFKRATLAGAL